MPRFACVALVLLLTSCAIQYDGETRLIVETQVNDPDGHPLAGKAVGININDNFDSEVIANGFTNAAGFCRLSFPAPKSAPIRIEVSEYDNDYISQNYIGLQPNDFTDYKFNAAATLFRRDDVTPLHLELIQNGPDDEITNISVEATEISENIYYNQSADDIIYPKVDYILRKNQSAQLTYDVIVVENNIPVTTHHAEVIAIGVDPVTYPIIY